ncbi:hypothetical protein G7058_08895 [Jeotgalibaca porci]|uniref:Pilus assembly protein PilM n=1 Tax=Jeotgalibaca porci TaxID=1868793 RepID=A0A6G7WIP9_9LACT|nr:hypothetical protein [Jeotgalibaca porci]QIK52140.1 hypothetical protein G7058_08895 [Jeotgalibaca porci]
MLFKKKPNLYFEFLETRIRYVVTDPQSQAVIDKAEIQFETKIINEGKITNPSLIQNRLHALVTEKKWKNAKASLLLPDDSVVIREEIIPGQLTEAEVKDYLNLHMGQSIRSPFKETSFHHEIVWQSETEKKVILMLYPTATTREFEAILTGANLDPQFADISSLCLYRMIESNNDIKLADDNHTLVFQWTPTHTTNMVFNQNLPKFARNSRNPNVFEDWELTAEGEWLWKKDQQSLLGEIKETLDVLERFLEFYRYSVLDGKNGITEIVLAGDFSYMEELKENMENRFYLPIHHIKQVEEVESKYLPLYGLSMKQKGTNKTKRKVVKEA